MVDIVLPHIALKIVRGTRERASMVSRCIEWSLGKEGRRTVDGIAQLRQALSIARVGPERDRIVADVQRELTSGGNDLVGVTLQLWELGWSVAKGNLGGVVEALQKIREHKARAKTYGWLWKYRSQAPARELEKELNRLVGR